jgi:uncharacterized membrane protein YhaH (DUF805 family)
MGFTEAISSGFSNYVGFAGRACRSEYWYWTLFAIIVAIVAIVIDIVVFPDMEMRPVNTIVGLALFLPGLAVAIRRLHDLDRTGWWFLIAFTGIGLILLLVWDCMKGTTGPNRYGPDPLEGQH